METNKTQQKDYMIETINLCKNSGNHKRVRNLQLKVPKNCVYGFLGPNGAGKSTTLKLILGLITPSNGTIYLMEKKWFQATAYPF